MRALRRRKPFFIGCAYAHRVLLPVAGLIPLLLPRSAWVWAYLAVYFAGNLGNALGGLPWQPMMADLVPPEVRGRYFGLRNGVLQGLGIATALAAGRFLDRHHGFGGFQSLYVTALAVGLVNVSLIYLQPEPVYVRGPSESPLAHLVRPVRSRPFRYLVAYIVILTVASGVAAPFYSVRMIQDLKLTYSAGSFLALTGLWWRWFRPVVVGGLEKVA